MGRTSIGAQLRAANPLPVAAPSRPSTRRIVLLVAAAVLVLAALAAAARISVHYLDQGGPHPVPPAVRRAFEQRPGVDAGRALHLYTYASGGASTSVYAAPFRQQAGYCTAEVRRVGVHVACLVGGGGGKGVSQVALPALPELYQPRLPGDVRVVLGRLKPPATRVDIDFEDGAVAHAAVSRDWFVYVVAGLQGTIGHRPVALRALDGDGHLVVRRPLYPASFTGLAAAQSALGAAHTSEQAAARAAVVAALHRGGPVGIPTNQLDIARARLAYRIVRGAHSFSAYVIPWTRAADGRERGVLMIGVDERGQATQSMGAMRPRHAHSGRPGDLLFGSGGIGAPAGGNWGVLELDGQIPDGATRVVIRLHGGRWVAPRFSYAGTWWTWFAVDRLRASGSHPVEMLALDARGRVVARHGLGSYCGRLCR
jgi:hypothetical protein